VATEVVMPQMGYDMTEGKILRWLKKEGDSVKRGDIIAEIETGKVDIEVEAFASGVLGKIVAQEGETVPVGQVIAVIAAPGEKAPEVRAEAAMETPPSPLLEKTAVEERPAGITERVPASPLAKKLAQERGVDLHLIKGTGPSGRITKEDVEAFLGTKEPPPATMAPPEPQVVVPPAQVTPSEVEYEERPLSRMRQTIARRMAESKRTIPHFEVAVEVDMTEALKLRKAFNETFEGIKVTVTDLIVKAVAFALRQHPELNASYAGETVRVHTRVNIGIAVAIQDGLVTPVISDCAEKPLKEIAKEAHEKAERAREGRFKPQDVVQGTFTVSNLGMFDIESFTAIINPPEAAILAVGSVVPKPVVKEGQITVSDRMRVTLSVDHRVADGATAARFLQTFKQLLEQPLPLFL